MVKNETLSNINKLHHLKACLSYEANNFEAAWALLTRRYTNKRILVNAQFATFLGQNKINVGTAESIRYVLDISTDYILKSSNWCCNSIWFIADLYFDTKLDVNTVKAFEQTRNNNDYFNTFADFSTFLENGCRMFDLVPSFTTTSERKYRAPTHHSVNALQATQSIYSVLFAENPNIWSTDATNFIVYHHYSLHGRGG